MKEISIITSYFPPETGAASNRIFHLAEGLQKKGCHVTIITPLPNYPTGKIFRDYRGKFRQTSIENNIKIYRLWIYASNSKNKLVRLFAMLSYSISLILFFIGKKMPKTVIVQSPPLLVAHVCIRFLKSKSRKIILNVSDLWPAAGLELGAFKKNWSYKRLEKIESYNYKNADLVLGQSREILSHVNALFPDKKTFLYRNYPNIENAGTAYKKNDSLKLRIVYAGLLGVAQGISDLCRKLDYKAVEFHIYGDGSERERIEKYIRQNRDLPVFYHGEVSREQLHKLILHYDIAIIPLKNRIYGSVPSKIYEYAFLGMPMLYFGGGEGEEIIKKHQFGWVANAGDYNNLNAVISKINKEGLNEELREKIRQNAKAHFDFNMQLEQLIQVL